MVKPFHYYLRERSDAKILHSHPGWQALTVLHFITTLEKENVHTIAFTSGMHASGVTIRRERNSINQILACFEHTATVIRQDENTRIDSITHMFRIKVCLHISCIHKIHLSSETRRSPRLLFLFDGVLLLRLEERQFFALLFQLPPRFTRFDPLHDLYPIYL